MFGGLVGGRRLGGFPSNRPRPVASVSPASGPGGRCGPLPGFGDVAAPESAFSSGDRTLAIAATGVLPAPCPSSGRPPAVVRLLRMVLGRGLVCSGVHALIILFDVIKLLILVRLLILLCLLIPICWREFNERPLILVGVGQDRARGWECLDTQPVEGGVDLIRSTIDNPHQGKRIVQGKSS